MIETLLSLGIFGVLIYIATKMAVVNDVTHEIRDTLKDITLKGGGGVPPTLPPSEARVHTAWEK